MRGKSIRSSLTRGLLAGLLLLVLLCEALVFVQVRRTLYRRFDEALIAQADVIISLVELEDDQLAFEYAEKGVVDVSGEEQARWFQIVTADDQVLWSTPDFSRIDLPRLNPGSLAAPQFYTLNISEEANLRAAAIRFRPVRGETIAFTEEEMRRHLVSFPPLRLVVANSLTPLTTTLRRLGIVFAVFDLALLTGILIFVPLVVRWGLSPLHEVGQRVSALDEENLETRFSPDQLPVELQPIAGVLNDFLDRIEEAMKRERRFTADVAHELRTPIAELRSAVEVALKWPQGRKEGQETLKGCLDVALRMQNLVEILLEMSRCQMGMRALSLESCEVKSLVQRCWAPLESQALEKQITLDEKMHPPSRIVTDAQLFQGIIGNCLANAVEYAPRESAIRLRAGEADGRWHITIANRHDTIERDDLEKMFLPFWQKDTSRSNRQSSGLGLAIAAAYAALLRGRLDARLIEGGLIELTFSQPLDGLEVESDSDNDALSFGDVPE